MGERCSRLSAFNLMACIAAPGTTEAADSARCRVIGLDCCGSTVVSRGRQQQQPRRVAACFANSTFSFWELRISDSSFWTKIIMCGHFYTEIRIGATLP